MIRAKFPVHERVKAGVPYKTMLQEVGIIGASIVVATGLFTLYRETKLQVRQPIVPDRIR